MKTEKTEGVATIADAARIKGVSRQSIHAAIDRKDLVAVEIMMPTRFVTLESLDTYQPNANKRRTAPKNASNGHKRKSKRPQDSNQ